MKRNTLILFFLLLILPTANLRSQAAELPFHSEQTNIDFGLFQGKEIDQQMIEYCNFFYYLHSKAGTKLFPSSDYLIVSQTVAAKDIAPWIRLRFADVNLGENSYLVITSQKDNDRQYFSSQTIKVWKNQTAFFNGSELRVDLYVAPGDVEVTLKIIELQVGEFMGNQPPSDYLCGSDSRVSSGYPKVDGRILPIGCSGWMTAAGFFVTAGHCLDVTSTNLQVIQFNVPASLCDGTPVACAVADQYPIIYSSIIFQNTDVGNDWGIFNVGANSSTGQTPSETERSYYHISSSLAPSSILVRGFGTDQNPTGCDGTYNSDSQTLQYDTGSNLGEYFNGSSDVYFEYLCDTQNGSSGSVLQASGISGVSAHAIGVHTYGACNSPTTGNMGTSFEADDTEAAMNSYWQSNCEYVDEGHHQSSTIGSSVRPCESLQAALNQADAGHGPGVTNMELIFVAGSNNGSGGVYAESISYSGAVNGVYIRRTGGGIKIGPNASAKTPSNDLDIFNKGKKSPTTKNTGDQPNFDENMILPGQTKPFKEIRNHENE